jgi:GxxExxY protein
MGSRRKLTVTKYRVNYVTAQRDVLGVIVKMKNSFAQRRGEKRDAELPAAWLFDTSVECGLFLYGKPYHEMMENLTISCNPKKSAPCNVLSWMKENDITGKIVDCAYQVHSKLGPGLFESVYEELLAYEFDKRKLNYLRQVTLPVVYEGVQLDVAFRADFVVEEKVIVENKAVDQIAAIHHTQLRTYLRVTDLTVGLLINFNEVYIKDGIYRIVNNFRD